MDQPGLDRAQRQQGFGHRPDQRVRKGAGQLPPHPGGVGQRPEDVEDRPGAQFGPHRADMAHRRMVHRRHHEADPGLGQAAFHHLGADHHVQAQFGQRIGRAGFRRQVAVAVLGHRHAGAGDDEGRRGRDVQRALAVAAGADDVHRARGRPHGVAFRPHHVAAAAYSSTVSPRVRSAIRKPPIWAGVASPSNRAVKAARPRPGSGAGWRRCRSAASAPRSCRAPSRGPCQEIAQQLVAMFAGDAFGVELHALDQVCRGGAGP
jgi:hypothetical protein